MRLNDATPADWNRVAREIPAIDPNDSITLKPYTDMAMEEAHDIINKPKHYNTGNIECIEAIEESMTPEAYRGYLKGNTLKYLWRYERKDKALQDLEKAQWYLNRLIEEVGR